MPHARLVLGLDPGLRRTGWGVIMVEGNRLLHVANGTISADAGQELAIRLREIHEGVTQIIADHGPHEAAVEETFVNANPTATLKLGQARGAVMLAPALAGLPVAEYAPNQVKKSVVGAGHADKGQIRAMVQVLLPGVKLHSDDSADALAIAICHAHHRPAPAIQAAQ